MERRRLHTQENLPLIREFANDLRNTYLIFYYTVVNTAWAQWQMSYL